MADFALKRPIPLFALAALLSIVGGLCIGAFPVGFAELLSAIGLSDRPLDDTTAAVLYAIRAPRVIAAFTVGAALAAGGAAMQSLFRNPLADPGLLGVSSGAALAAVSVMVLGEKVMHIVPPALKPWLLPIAAFLGGLLATIIVYRLPARRAGQRPPRADRAWRVGRAARSQHGRTLCRPGRHHRKGPADGAGGGAFDPGSSQRCSLAIVRVEAAGSLPQPRSYIVKLSPIGHKPAGFPDDMMP